MVTVCFISRGNLERVSQGPEAPLVHQDLLDLELLTARYVNNSNTLYFHCLKFSSLFFVLTR